ncbi:MAG: hypothetical protein O7C68_01655, partial [Rickettsia endosymbiont of Ixodes ricinus]|nr:hypothetical protein [Rickettsia endosymbiont of Ixodes ricinus]
MFKKSLFILLLLVASLVKAEIIEVDSLNKIKQDFKENYNKNPVPNEMQEVGLNNCRLFKTLLP